jgi:diadenosine tetraphosphate (Ap4A) HIT family hydrolase
MFIAPDLDTFKSRFAAGLENMLTPDGLGAFILVLANSMQDSELFQWLANDLDRTFAQLQAATPDAPEDDQIVFSALAKTGIQGLSCWEYQPLEPWELVINPLRALRPARGAGQLFSGIHQAFDPGKFHFNKPFLRPEILWEGETGGIPLRVLYNKFPFAPWHLLVVPEPEQNLPQLLTQAHHTHMMELVTEQAQRLPGLGMAFNSYGAYASVNHLHFQGFVRETPFPLEQACWRHHGGQQDYPVECILTHDSHEAWQTLEELHHANQPYNLLYRENACYILPRKAQGLVDLPAWAFGGIGWHDLCGVLALPDITALGMEKAEELAQFLGTFNRNGCTEPLRLQC